MCYADTYQCTISCLNSDLNITEAMNGSIESVGLYGSGCHVTSCQIIEHLSEGFSGGGAITQTTPEPIHILLAFVVAVIIGVGIYLIRMGRI